jgi:hypothetical protein
VIPPYCRLKVDAVFWGGRQWLELGQAIANDYSQCAEYFITIPPQDGDRTMLRLRPRFDEIRALNPRIHPVARSGGRLRREAGASGSSEGIRTGAPDAPSTRQE